MKLTNEYQTISGDSLGTCANLAKLYNDKVKICTVYRYGKSTYRIMPINRFNTMLAKRLL